MSMQDILYKHKKYIIDSYNNGISTTKLAIQFRCNSGTIWYFLKNMGVKIKEKKKDRIENYKEEVVTLYNMGWSCCRIAKKLNFANASIVKYIKTIGLDTSRYCRIDYNNLLVNRKDEVIKMYLDGLSTLKIGKITGHYSGSVRTLLINNGIELRENRLYTVNNNFFDKIDNEFNSYAAGFCCADGNINLAHNTVRFFQTEGDHYILDNIKKCMEYTGPIYKTKRDSSRKTIYTLTISSKHCVNSLIKLGCVPAKSSILEFPNFDQIPRKFMSSFLRGVFDGDGSIQKITRGTYAPCSITSSDKFCEALNIFMFCELGIQGQFYYRYKDRPERKCGSLMFTKKDSVKKFLDYIYKDLTPSSLFLKRKYLRYIQMFYNGVSPHGIVLG